MESCPGAPSARVREGETTKEVPRSFEQFVFWDVVFPFWKRSQVFRDLVATKWLATVLFFGCPNWSKKNYDNFSWFRVGISPKTGKKIQCHFKPWMIRRQPGKSFGFQIWNARKNLTVKPQDGKPQCWNQSSSRLQGHRKVEAFRFLTGDLGGIHEYVIIIIIIIMMHTVIMNHEYYCWYHHCYFHRVYFTKFLEPA